MPRQFSRLLMVCLSAVIGLSACNAQETAKGPGTSDAKAVAVVNGVPIPQSTVDYMIHEREAQGQSDTPDLREAVINDLVSREVVSQAAIAKGLEKQPDVATQLGLAKQAILIRSYLKDYLEAHPVTDEMIKAEYDKIKAQMGDKEYKVRHILVSDEAEAKAIIAQLKKGANFAKLAKEKSLDAGSKEKGGELGWVTPNSMVKPFAEAMEKLKKGAYTQTPVHSKFGWHVIQLENERPLQTPSLHEVSNQLRQRIQQEQVSKAIADLRAKAKIELMGNGAKK